MSGKEAAIYFSDLFGVDAAVLDRYGAFDVSLVNDLPLFVDPFLLFNSKRRHYQDLHDSIIRYLRFLRDEAVAREATNGRLEALFTFKEVKQNWLGFSKRGNRGSGLGPDFARSLHHNLRTVFQDFGSETETKGSHLERLALIRDGVGKDNISDFATVLIKEYLLGYTQTFALEHLHPDQIRSFTIEKVSFNYDTQSWTPGTFSLPIFRGDYVILTPKNILTKDRPWISRSELISNLHDVVGTMSNVALREQLNHYLYSRLTEKSSDKEVRLVRAQAIEQFPQVIQEYIKLKEEHEADATAASASRVREAEALFVHQVTALRHALSLSKFYEVEGDTYEEARQRILYLKEVVEAQDGYRVFFPESQLLQREEHLQVFYLLTWCRSAADVNREVNNGRGPVDFKISKGAKDRVLVEFKLAKNKKLEQNLKRQVDIYKRASATKRALKVITFFTASEEARVGRILRRLGLQDDPDIILIDARADNKPSASNAA